MLPDSFGNLRNLQQIKFGWEKFAYSFRFFWELNEPETSGHVSLLQFAKVSIVLWELQQLTLV